VQELTLDSGTDLLTGQDKPRQDRAGRSVQEETSRTGQAHQDKKGRAQVSRSGYLDLDLVASFELNSNQSGSEFI
jgi:hypothetical protein